MKRTSFPAQIFPGARYASVLTAKRYKIIAVYAVITYYTIFIIQWYIGAYGDKESQRDGRNKKRRYHRACTPPEEWKKWDISFPDTDDET